MTDELRIIEFAIKKEKKKTEVWSLFWSCRGTAFGEMVMLQGKLNLNIKERKV